MNSISTEIVEKTWKAVKHSEDEQLPEIIGQLSDDQPLLMAYLINIGEELLNEDEQELLFFFGLLIWQMMSQGEKPLRELTEEALSHAEQANVMMLERMGDEPDSIFRSEMRGVLEGYNQPHLLNFVVEVVTEAVQDEEIQERNYGPMILYLKTVIDGLDR